MAGKVPTLRPGLSVDDLVGKNAWVGYYGEHGIPEVVDVAVAVALKGLIAKADSGGRVHRKVVSQTLGNIADTLKALSSTITDRMGKGELTPSVLDELAGI